MSSQYGMKRNVFEYDSSDEEPEQAKPSKVKKLNLGRLETMDLGLKSENFVAQPECPDASGVSSSELEDYANMEFKEESSKMVNSLPKLSLDNPIQDSIGLKMMQKMGFKLGDTLGKTNDASHLVEPIKVMPKLGRKGIGATHGGKESTQKFHPASVQEYRDSAKDKHETARKKKTLAQLQKFCYGESGDETKVFEGAARIEEVNVMWRRIAIDSVQRNPKRTLLFDEEEKPQGLKILDNGEIGCQKVPEKSLEVSGNLKTEDFADSADFLQFESLPLSDQLQKLLNFTRGTYFYCPYCSVKYDSPEDLENCPGPNESDHIY